MGSSRGTAHHLPEGRFAVPDPDDPDRMTYWRVESTNADGSKKELRPWPADVRWAPLRPPYPPDLDKAQRRQWTDGWYASEYFGWKDEVVAAIAADPQAAADEFSRSAPTAVLPEPTKPRPRQRVRKKPMSKKAREVAAQKLFAEALRRAGMSERQMAAEMGLPKTTARRRLQGGAVADGLAAVFIEARIAQLMAQVIGMAQTASPEDLPRLQAQLEHIHRLQATATGAPVPQEGSPLGEPFGPRLAGDDR